MRPRKKRYLASLSRGFGVKIFFSPFIFFFFFFRAKEFFLSQVLVKTTENKENSAKIVSPMATYPSLPPAHPKRILALGYFGYTKLCCCCPPKFRTAPHQMARIRLRMGGRILSLKINYQYKNSF